MKILFLTHICPYPPTNGGAIKTFNILKHLGARHDVSLVTFVRRASEIEALEHLKPYCREIRYAHISRSALRNVVDAGRSVLSGSSFIISRDHRSEMRRSVQELLGTTPDILYVDHLQMFQYVPDPAPCPVILDEHNVEWRIMERFAESTSIGSSRKAFTAIEWRKLRDYELRACKRADLVLTVTPTDHDTLVANGINETKVLPIPIGVDVEQFKPVPSSPDSQKVISLGTMSWPPNIDAIKYFTSAIYPRIKQELAGVTFSIIGSSPPSEITSLAATDASINVTGFVEDVRDAVVGTAAFVVPLRIGSGMRVKILDAMAMGLPIVTTSIGCEGISLEPGRHALVADTPSEFADSVVRLIKDSKERNRLSSEGRMLVESTYAWDIVLKELDDALGKIR